MGAQRVTLENGVVGIVVYDYLFYCPACGRFVNAVSTLEDAAVCELDGYVLEGGSNIAGVPCVPRALKSTYKRIFHFNERMALFMLEDPPIPNKLYELIEDEAWTGYLEGRYPHPDDVWFRDISKICSAVRVPA